MRQLDDESLERVHHLIRKDALSDLEIAAEAEKLHGKKLWKTEAAAQRAVARYRDSATFKRWLTRWENQDADLKRSIETQKQRFELLSKLVQDDREEGLETLSKGLQARMLTLAAEADDDELKAFMSGKGWVKNVMALVQKTVHDRYRHKAEQLKEEIERMLSAPKAKARPAEVSQEIVKTVDKVLGLA